MNFLIHGAGGRMGRQVIEATQKAGHKVLAAVDVMFAESPIKDVDFPCYASLSEVNSDGIDCIIDFSNHITTIPLLRYALANRLPVMLATTGQTEEELDAISKASNEIPIFRSANMSLGVATLCRLLKSAVKMFPDADIEIIEQHHNQKLDVPSGTALALANVIKSERENASFLVGRHENGKRTKNEVGIHSLRLGNVVGIHEVIINNGNETITLKHEAHSRAVFADGAVIAAEFIAKKPAGIYSMNDLTTND